MCNKHSMAYWLEDIRKETAWMNGATLTEVNIIYLLGAVKMRVKRIDKRGNRQITFIEASDIRTCLRLLWAEANSGNSGVIWRQDKYATRQGVAK